MQALKQSEVHFYKNNAPESLYYPYTAQTGFLAHSVTLGCISYMVALCNRTYKPTPYAHTLVNGQHAQ